MIAIRESALGYEKRCRIIWILFVLHMCFLIHTLMGLIIAGFFPSLAATYATIRTWFLDDDDRWTWRTAWTVFHDVWKTDCGAANLFGWMQVMIGLFLGWDYYLVQTHNFGHLFTVAVSGVLLVVNMFYWLFAIMSWLIRAHFQENTWRIVRMSIAMSIARPLSSVCIIVFFSQLRCGYGCIGQAFL